MHHILTLPYVNVIARRSYIGHIRSMADTSYPIRKLIYLSLEQAEQVSEFRHEHRIGSENEAIRRLLALGLQKAGELKKEPKENANG